MASSGAGFGLRPLAAQIAPRARPRTSPRNAPSRNSRSRPPMLAPVPGVCRVHASCRTPGPSRAARLPPVRCSVDVGRSPAPIRSFRFNRTASDGHSSRWNVKPGKKKAAGTGDRKLARQADRRGAAGSAGEVGADLRPVGVALGDVAGDVRRPLGLHVLGVVEVELAVDDPPGRRDRSSRCSPARPPRRSSRHIAARTSPGRRRTGRGSRPTRSARWRPSIRARSRSSPGPAGRR